MRMSILLVLLISLISISSFAQAPPISWNVTNINGNIMNSLEDARGITAIPNVGYMMTGHTKGYYYDVINVLLSPNGTVLNSFTFGESYSELSGKIKTSIDGNVVNVYSQENYCHLRNYPLSSMNFYDLRIRKSNPTAGAVVWDNCYGGTGIDYGYDITELNDGSFVAVGSSTAGQNNTADGDITSIYGGADIWVLKVSSTGGKLWSKNFGTANQDVAYGITKSNDGNVIVAGNQGSNAWAAKINVANGSILWSIIVTPESGKTHSFSSVKEDANGNLVFCGSSNSTLGDFSGNHGGNDLWIYKTDASGNKIWSSVFGGPGNENGASLVIENDNSMVITGSTTLAGGNVSKIWGGSDQWTIKVSSTGSLMWEKNMGSGGSDGGVDIVKAMDGTGYVTAASTNALYTSGDIYCPRGYLWAAKLGGTQQGIPTNPIVWFKADAGVTGSGNVTAWADQSGNNYHASVPSGTSGPALITNALNGKPVLRFNGSSALKTSNILNQGCRNKMHLFAVMKKNTTNLQQTIFDSKTGNNNASANGVQLKSNLGGTTCTNCLNDNGLAATSIVENRKSTNATDATSSQFHNKENCYMLVEVVFDGSLNSDEMKLFIDGDRVLRNQTTDDDNSFSYFTDEPFTIGGELISGVTSNFFNGDIAEIIVYPYILNNKTEAYTYLREKYFPGTINNFSSIANTTITSNLFSNNGQWKFPYASSQSSHAIVAVEDPCNGISTLGATAYIDANSMYTAPNGTKFLKRHYKISCSQTGDRKVRLYFTQQEFDDYKNALGGTFTLHDLQVVKYKGPTEDDTYNPDDATELLTLTPTIGDEYNNKYAEVTVNSFSEFWLKVNPSALSVSFGNIKAYIKDHHLQVFWKTFEEKNSEKFEIQVSKNGKDFNTIGSINSLSKEGISSNELNYQFQTSTSNLPIILISLFAFLGLTNMKSRRQKSLLLVFLIGFAISFWTCTKNEKPINDDGTSIFVRVVQVDKNGAKHNSKIIKVIKE